MINQVKRFLCKRTLYLLQHRHYCEHPGKVLYPLINRKLIKVAGSESAVYLQGLITNDMRHFEDGAKSMYAMFLNTKGRILYDTLILKLNDDYLLECDKPIVSALQKHLKIYKLKRQITIEDVSERYKIGALISDPNKVIEPTDDPKTQVNIYKDPRLNELGHRVLMSADVSEEKVKEIIGENTRISDSDRGYKYLRYTLGVSEGAEDISPGTSFPLEANCDYLHGVSFHKGCYIGQELTARVHHTGVVRKRMMPIKFTEEVQGLEVDTIISTKSNPKSNFGKLKGYVADYGLGIVRIKEALESKDLTIGKYSVDVQKPTWWPIEAPKEKVTAVKE